MVKQPHTFSPWDWIDNINLFSLQFFSLEVIISFATFNIKKAQLAKNAAIPVLRYTHGCMTVQTDKPVSFKLKLKWSSSVTKSENKDRIKRKIKIIDQERWHRKSWQKEKLTQFEWIDGRKTIVSIACIQKNHRQDPLQPEALTEWMEGNNTIAFDDKADQLSFSSLFVLLFPPTMQFHWQWGDHYTLF